MEPLIFTNTESIWIVLIGIPGNIFTTRYASTQYIINIRIKNGHILNVMQNQVALNWDVHMMNSGRRQLGLPTGMERLDNPPPERTPWGATNGKARSG